MGTVFDFDDNLNNNSDEILLRHAIGNELVDELITANVTFKVNENGSVVFENCSDALLDKIREAKKKKD